MSLLFFLNATALIIALVLFLKKHKAKPLSFQNKGCTLLTLAHGGVAIILCAVWFTGVRHGCSDLNTSIFSVISGSAHSPVQTLEVPSFRNKRIYLYKFNEHSSNETWDVLKANTSDDILFIEVSSEPARRLQLICPGVTSPCGITCREVDGLDDEYVQYSLWQNGDIDREALANFLSTSLINTTDTEGETDDG